MITSSCDAPLQCPCVSTGREVGSREGDAEVAPGHGLALLGEVDDDLHGARGDDDIEAASTQTGPAMVDRFGVV
jgi:hypothetical protein